MGIHPNLLIYIMIIYDENILLLLIPSHCLINKTKIEEKDKKKLKIYIPALFYETLLIFLILINFF